MNFVLPLLLSFSFALIPWGVKRIDKKLKLKDYPTAEKREENEPTLATLMTEAKNREEYLAVMCEIANNRDIWWELRQDAVLYLGTFLKKNSVTQILKGIVANDKEEYELRETAYRVLSPVNLSKKAKIALLSRFAKSPDAFGKLHLRIAKDLADLGAKKLAKQILKSLVERPTLDPVLRTDAEEFLKFLN